MTGTLEDLERCLETGRDRPTTAAVCVRRRYPNGEQTVRRTDDMDVTCGIGGRLRAAWERAGLNARKSAEMMRSTLGQSADPMREIREKAHQYPSITVYCEWH